MYRPPSVRNFKKYVGELTAEAAGTQVAVLQAQENNKTEGGWSRKASEFDIVISGVSGSRVLNSHIRLSIVSVYSGFDLFVEEIAKESKKYGFYWVNVEKVSPLVVLKKNFTKAPNNETTLRKLFDCVDYYRYVRNSVAHPSKENTDKAIEEYKSRKKSLEYVRSNYEMRTAPSHPETLSFHDIKLLCRILIDVTEEIGVLLEPSDQQYFDSIQIDKWTQYGNNKKAKYRAAKTYLVTEYSITYERATDIVEKCYGPFA